MIFLALFIAFIIGVVIGYAVRMNQEWDYRFTRLYGRK